ncbi:murein hydrolase activator EnvC [Kiloniella sp. EL199]|uniref:murein hydrolase activator EnvC family protein n=1 Tax=Kiloniella sp. EL199 TaxID=2107581 RepID=UPI0013C49054|nr:peptidoglycan DD-metalloendopeptidase family protein [Kiloniella sp. EL199]
MPNALRSYKSSTRHSFFRSCVGLMTVAGLVFGASFFLNSAKAQDATEKLLTLEEKAVQSKQEAKRLSAQTKKLNAEVSGLRQQLIASAKKVQNYESDLTDIEETLISLEENAEHKKIRLTKNREKLGHTLSALQRIALLPPEALVAAPGSPVDTVRSAMLLKVAVPEIETRVESLRDDLDELAELKNRIEDERAALLASQQHIKRERKDLNALLNKKQKLQSKAQASQKSVTTRVKKLAQQARNMKDLVKKLEAERKRLALAAQKPKPRPEKVPNQTQQTSTSETSFPSEQQVAKLTVVPDPSQIREFPSRQKRVLLYPARGRVISKYGQKRGTNESYDKGLVIATRPSAQVIAPFDGRIAYAGEFRGYGRILIIEHSGRYHTLLAGVERIDVIEGQWVLAGEPVARMSDKKLEHAEIYFELRQGGQPINPSPWILTNKTISNLDKVNG